MVIGGEKITESADRLLKNIELNDDNDLVEIEEVFVIAVVHYGDPDENSSSGSLFYRCTSAKYHVQQGILMYAGNAVKNSQNKEE